MYWEKRGLESVHLRILSCTPEPQNTRALGTWLSHADMIQLVERAIDTPTVGFSVIYGVSANIRAPVSNARLADWLTSTRRPPAPTTRFQWLGPASATSRPARERSSSTMSVLPLTVW